MAVGLVNGTSDPMLVLCQYAETEAARYHMTNLYGGAMRVCDKILKMIDETTNKLPLYKLHFYISKKEDYHHATDIPYPPSYEWGIVRLLETGSWKSIVVNLSMLEQVEFIHRHLPSIDDELADNPDTYRTILYHHTEDADIYVYYVRKMLTHLSVDEVSAMVSTTIATHRECKNCEIFSSIAGWPELFMCDTFVKKVLTSCGLCDIRWLVNHSEYWRSLVSDTVQLILGRSVASYVNRNTKYLIELFNTPKVVIPIPITLTIPPYTEARVVRSDWQVTIVPNADEGIMMVGVVISYGDIINLPYISVVNNNDAEEVI